MIHDLRVVEGFDFDLVESGEVAVILRVQGEA
jgi:hypothetical protein